MTGSASRRDFLRTAASLTAGLAFPAIVPSRVLGKEAPSHRITMACIGVGRMGTGDMRTFMGFPEVQILSVCDVDSKRAANAKALVESTYRSRMESGEYKGCDATGDFREVISREDVDAVTVVTPDHWHTLPALYAAKAGKDVFLQKPLTLTIEEGRVLSDAVQRYGRILQVGSQQRSDSRMRFACELVRNGRIGKVHTVKVAVGTDPPTGLRPPMPVPDNLDYEFWLGPAPWAPYTEDRVHPQEGYGRPGWLRVRDYGAGMITGWGAHHIDIAQWGLGMERGGPVSVEGTAQFPPDGVWDVHGPFFITYTYESGVQVIFADSGQFKSGITFEGSEGWVWTSRGAIDAEPKSLLKETLGPDEIHLYESRNHMGNFLECIKTRREPVAPVEIGHRSCTTCLLGDIAIRLGRKLKWDPAKERFVQDEGANRFLSKPMRSPWVLG